MVFTTIALNEYGEVAFALTAYDTGPDSDFVHHSYRLSKARILIKDENERRLILDALLGLVAAAETAETLDQTNQRWTDSPDSFHENMM